MEKDEQEDRKSPDEPAPKGVTRRGFLTSVSAGAAGLVLADRLGNKPAEAVEVTEPGEASRIELIVNGRKHRLLVEPRWSLLFVLREHLGLTGTKVGCERGECGACTVLINSVPHYACMTLAVEVDGKEVTTVEGLMHGEELGPVQQAFIEKDAYQCGYCTPGQIMAVEGLLRKKPSPTRDEVREGVSGNLCRCGAYVNIFKAAHRAAELKKAGRSS